MDVIRLTEDNVWSYEDFIPEDISENIGRSNYRGLIALLDEKPVGGMIWMLRHINAEEDRESHIVWLCADEEEIGTGLMAEYEEKIWEDGVVTTTVSLPARTSQKEKQILANAGFEIGLTEGDEIVAHLSEIMEIPFVKKMKQTDIIKPLRSVTQRVFNKAVERMVKMGHFGICEDIEDLSRVFFENDVSCYAEEEGNINGFLLCHKRPSGKISVELLAALGRDYQKLVALLISHAVTKAAEIYLPETEIVIDRHNYGTLALGEKLFPRSFGMPVYAGSRTEK